ncbi:MAG: hypothetical protein H6Q73_2859 [Firmicutes bacterium]|nr:hypothetical protein [Bacillota bacterium]
MQTQPPNNNKLTTQLEKLAYRLEAIRLADYVELLEKPRKLIFANFIAGISRGLGFAVGTTIVFAIVVELLRRIILINIPLINEYLIDIIQLIDLKK